MKKFLCSLIFVSLLFSFALAEESAPLSFRHDLTLDSTLEDIKSAEGVDPTFALGQYVMYQNASAANRTAEILYMMGSDSTIDLCMIAFTDKHSEENLYVIDYDSLDSLLTEKYGEPTKPKDVTWLDDLFMDDPNNLGLAISSGQASVFTHWDLDGLYIVHCLAGDNYSIKEAILYSAEDPTGATLLPVGGSLGI